MKKSIIHNLRNFSGNLVRIVSGTIFMLVVIAAVAGVLIILGSLIKSMQAYETLISEILLGLIAVAMLSYLIMKRMKLRIRKGTVLVYDLEGTVKEEPPEAFAEALLKPEMTFIQVLKALDYAMTDNNVSMLLIRIRNLRMGWGKLAELHQRIKKWEKTGKPVYCFLGDASNKEYVLATAGSKVYLNTGSLLLFNGLAVETPYLKNFFDKFGIEAEFEKVGSYKTSFDPFTQDHMSAEHKEMMSSIMNEIQNYIVKEVAQSRKMTEEKIRNTIAVGMFSYITAKELKLIDDTMSLDEMKAHLQEQNKKTECVPLAKYFQIRKNKLSRGARSHVAMISVNGALQEGQSSFHPIFGKMAGSDQIIELLDEASKNKNICGIVMRINSPGGSGSASELIWRKIKSVSEKKPVAVSMGDVAASGGYYIASAAHFISANPLTITGSIGVLSGKVNIENLLYNLHINVEKIMTAENANMLSFFSHMNENQKNLLKKINEDFYALFLQRIVEGRKISHEEVEKAADGRIWLALQALEFHLIDSINGIDDAINFIKSKKNIPPGQPVKIIPLIKRKPLWQRFKFKLPF